MKIIGSSIYQAVESYLHSGYISAYPRSYEGWSLEGAEPSLAMDVAAALQLETEVLASAATTFGDAGLASLTATGDLALMLTGGAAFFAALGLASLKSPRTAAAAAATAAVLGAGAVGCDTETEPLDPPWEDVAVQAYASPEAATQAILYGIVADGLANTDRTVHSLADIQYEVGLPTDSPTEGMAYALSTYGLDGWGLEMRLESVGDTDTAEEVDGAWIVTSAGADGSFDTVDDIAIHVLGSTDGNWDNNRYAHFVDGSGGELKVWFHRWSGGHFEYRHTEKGSLFDYLGEGDLLDEDTKARLRADWDAAAADVSHTPLLLQVYRTL